MRRKDRVAGRRVGYKCSVETKAKISATLKKNNALRFEEGLTNLNSVLGLWWL